MLLGGAAAAAAAAAHAAGPQVGPDQQQNDGHVEHHHDLTRGGKKGSLSVIASPAVVRAVEFCVPLFISESWGAKRVLPFIQNAAQVAAFNAYTA